MAGLREKIEEAYRGKETTFRDATLSRLSKMSKGMPGYSVHKPSPLHTKMLPVSVHDK